MQDRTPCRNTPRLFADGRALCTYCAPAVCRTACVPCQARSLVEPPLLHRPPGPCAGGRTCRLPVRPPPAGPPAGAACLHMGLLTLPTSTVCEPCAPSRHAPDLRQGSQAHVSTFCPGRVNLSCPSGAAAAPCPGSRPRSSGCGQRLGRPRSGGSTDALTCG